MLETVEHNFKIAAEPVAHTPIEDTLIEQPSFHMKRSFVFFKW